MEIKTIRTFNRFELKYLISRRTAERFKHGLRAYLDPDVNGNADGRYRLGNLYFDSPGLRCFHEKEDGVRVRRKLRIRYYETDENFSEEKQVFVEIKQRINRVTQKRRIVLAYGDALRLCVKRELPFRILEEDQKTLEEIYVFSWQYNLQPASIVRYSRSAFIGKRFDVGLRVTFDDDLVTQLGPLHLHERNTCVPLLNPNYVVMEIKANNRIPIWLSEMVAAYNLKTTAFSKYNLCIRASQAAQTVLKNRFIPQCHPGIGAETYPVFQPQALKAVS